MLRAANISRGSVSGVTQGEPLGFAFKVAAWVVGEDGRSRLPTCAQS